MKEQVIIEENVLDPERQNETGGCITTSCTLQNTVSYRHIAVITIISLITVIKFCVGVTQLHKVNNGGEATNKPVLADGGAIN